jgi:hypothetical protein
MINKKVSGSTSTTSSSTTSSTTSSSNTLLYLILFVFIAFIYLQYRNHLSSSTNPYLNLIINVILYIPCLFVILIEYINKQISEKNNTYFTIIIIEIVLIILYISSIFLRTYYVNKNGTVLIRDPIELNIKTNLTLPSGYPSSSNLPLICDTSGNITLNFDGVSYTDTDGNIYSITTTPKASSNPSRVNLLAV